MANPQTDLALTNGVTAANAAGPDGIGTLLGNPMINAIHAPRQRMVFSKPGTALTFLLNPQSVKRSKGVVEQEFPTMGAWHTYRWMEEPTVWEISGYAGLMGETIRKYIEQLDGEDSIIWSYPYVGPPVEVKIMETQMPYDAKVPFSHYYYIRMRENSTVVLNQSSDKWGVTRLSPTFVSPTYNLSNSGNASDTWQIQANEKDLATVVQDIIKANKSSAKFDDQYEYMKQNNQLDATSWPNDLYPKDSNKKDKPNLVFRLT